MTDMFADPARWRLEEHGRAQADVHPLDWNDDFGPLTCAQFVEFIAHERAVTGAAGDPGREHDACRQLGYADAAHFGRVRTTFLKYWGKSTGGDPLRSFVWDDAALAMTIGTLDRAESAGRARETVAANPSMLSPEAGVPLDVCGWVYGCAQGGRAFDEALVATKLDAATWEAAHRGWERRIRADTTGALKALFSEAYHAGSDGRPLEGQR